MQVLIRPLAESELPEATQLVRIAFGTFFGLPEPHTLWPDRDYVGPRWRAAPENVFAAELDGRLAGLNVASRWGSFAFFGPLAVLPEHWNTGVAQKLLEPTVALFDAWQVPDAGLFTFPHSPKHLALYQKFGFWPRFLTALTFKPVAPTESVPFQTFSSQNDSGKPSALAHARDLAGKISEGLDLSSEISAVDAQSLGDTILTSDAFAVCHCGPATEAGQGICYVKFAAARDARAFDHLLRAVESFAASRHIERLETGVNLARREAWRALLARGFRATTQGIAMHRPDRDAFNRPGVFILDDWR
jgi:GNAT superfamily N-acetyltransferase